MNETQCMCELEMHHTPVLSITQQKSSGFFKSFSMGEHVVDRSRQLTFKSSRGGSGNLGNLTKVFTGNLTGNPGNLGGDPHTARVVLYRGPASIIPPPQDIKLHDA